MKAKVAERGQVTIPKRIRDHLGIRKGTVLDFREEKGGIVATKTETSHPVDACYGSLSHSLRTDQLMEELPATNPCSGARKHGYALLYKHPLQVNVQHNPRIRH